MLKSLLIFLVIMSMALFGSLAVAGEGWEVDFATALNENNLEGALMIASTQEISDVISAFDVDPEAWEQTILLLAGIDWCEKIKAGGCCDISPSDPQNGNCGAWLKNHPDCCNEY